MDAVPSDILAWLAAFAAAVRQEDYAAGRVLFDTNVVSFGTVCFRAKGLDQLVENQWRAIWGSTKGFDFDYPEAVGTLDGEHATVVATWQSTGFSAEGASFPRRGRATFILRQDANGWKAVHSHFSLAPQR